VKILLDTILSPGWIGLKQDLANRQWRKETRWGFAQFNDGKPADEAVHNTCFSCHQAAKARDFVFARYAL
jgi:hypothetical protein